MSDVTTQSVNTTPTKSPKGKVPKKTSAAKAVSPESKPPKGAKPKREKVPKDDLMVFAFRLTKAESAALHRAAGPANASHVMRALAGAFAAEDHAAFEAIIEDARKLRA